MAQGRNYTTTKQPVPWMSQHVVVIPKIYFPHGQKMKLYATQRVNKLFITSVSLSSHLTPTVAQDFSHSCKYIF